MKHIILRTWDEKMLLVARKPQGQFGLSWQQQTAGALRMYQAMIRKAPVIFHLLARFGLSTNA